MVTDVANQFSVGGRGGTQEERRKWGETRPDNAKGRKAGKGRRTRRAARCSLWRTRRSTIRNYVKSGAKRAEVNEGRERFKKKKAAN